MNTPIRPRSAAALAALGALVLSGAGMAGASADTAPDTTIATADSAGGGGPRANR